MGDFATSNDLVEYLTKINPKYGKYATPLWKGEIRSRAELANVSISTLSTYGISNIGHAENIQVYVKGEGTCELSQGSTC